MANKEVQEYLNDTVATLGVFYTKLHQHHWYVKGAHFYTLHEKFEELYDSVNEVFDEVAERLITIGGKPYSTLKEFLDHSAIQESPYTTEKSETEMVETVVADLRVLADSLTKGIQLTGDTGDDVTQDLLIGYKTDVEKNIWMYQAFLGKSPVE